MPSTRAWSRICYLKMLDSFYLHFSLSPSTLPFHLSSWIFQDPPAGPCLPSPISAATVPVASGYSGYFPVAEALYPRPFAAGLRRALARGLGKRRVPGERGWGRGEVRGERVEGEERTAEKQERHLGRQERRAGGEWEERGVGKGERQPFVAKTQEDSPSWNWSPSRSRALEGGRRDPSALHDASPAFLHPTRRGLRSPGLGLL